MVKLMDAVVLAAGMGKRMAPLSHLCPKPLIPVACKSLIDWVIDSLSKAGVSRLVVVVGYKGEEVRRHVEATWSTLDVQCVQAKDYFKGAGYSLLAAEEHVPGSFILCPADLITDHEVVIGTVKGMRKLRAPVIATGRSSRGGTAVLAEGDKCGEVIRIGGGAGGRVCIGVVALDSSFFTYLKRSLARGEGSVVSALRLYVDEGNTLGFVDFPGKVWFDVDTLPDVLDANRYILNAGLAKGGIYVPPGEVSRSMERNIRGSLLVGPVLVGLENQVESSMLGPNVSLSGGVKCKRAVVSNAVVFGGGEVTGVAKDVAVFGGVQFPARCVGH
ncbi:MAG: NTP transferase domain-containing protein [Candidatus Jordarchaeales archaeon]